ncbi:MAG: SMI1/KNR4 family protein [Bradymonadia bacterium]
MAQHYETLEDFISDAATKGVLVPDELVGCSDEEILALEAKYSVRLPNLYRQFLQTMGHGSGHLFQYDHFDAQYKDVLTLTEDYRNADHSLDESEYAPEVYAELLTLGPPPTLSEDSFIILGRLGDHFEFIQCKAASDSAVYYFNEETPVPTQGWGSVLDWLASMLNEATEALASGYFDGLH